MTGLSPTLSRALAVALLLCVALAAKYLAVEPVMTARAELADRIERADRLLGAIRTRRIELMARIEAAGEDPAGARDAVVFLAGSNPTLAGAQLQSRVQAMIEAAGAQLTSAQILRAEPRDGLLEVTLRTRMDAPIEAVQTIFHALESQRPYLFIDRVAIRGGRTARPLPRGANRRRVASQRVPEDHLTVSYDVIGYIRAGQGT